MSKQPPLVTVPLTPEEDRDARLRELDLDYALVRVAKAAGSDVAGWGEQYIIVSPEIFGLDAPPADDGHFRLKLPQIRRRDVFLPLDGRTLSARAFTSNLRKTPAKEREFLAKCTRKPGLTRHTAIETGAKFEYRGISTNEELAIRDANVAPGETVRAVLIDSKNERIAEEYVESNRDSLPWCEDLRLGPDGTLPIGWHGLSLNPVEQRLLRDQGIKERAQKRKRIEKLTRQMLREIA